MSPPRFPLEPLPAAELSAAFLSRVEAELLVDRAKVFLGYHIARNLRELRDHVRFRGWPRSFEERLNLSLIPYLDSEAREAGIDWTVQAPIAGALGSLFDIDARAMNAGRGRSDLTPAEFTRYVVECRALFDEFSAIRGRTHGGDP